MNLSNLDPTEGMAVFTDGSCSYRNKSGGWAWVALDAYGGMEAASGFSGDATTNRMELTAPIQALNALADEFGMLEVIVYSDSEYVVLGNNDHTRSRRKNADLWSLLDEARHRHAYVEWNHVYGHRDNKLNELADQLAGAARLDGLALADGVRPAT